MKQILLFLLMIPGIARANPSNVVRLAKVTTYCEFRLDKGIFESATTLAKLTHILDNITQAEPAFVNPGVTDKAFAVLGLPRTTGELTEFHLIRSTTAEAGFALEISEPAGAPIQRIPLVYPPLYTWKEMPGGTLRPADIFDLNPADLRLISLGFVYGVTEDARKVLTLSHFGPQIRVNLALDVPCRKVHLYTSSTPIEILFSNQQALCRVRVLSVEFER